MEEQIQSKKKISGDEFVRICQGVYRNIYTKYAEFYRKDSTGQDLIYFENYIITDVIDLNKENIKQLKLVNCEIYTFTVRKNINIDVLIITNCCKINSFNVFDASIRVCSITGNCQIGVFGVSHKALINVLNSHYSSLGSLSLQKQAAINEISIINSQINYLTSYSSLIKNLTMRHTTIGGLESIESTLINVLIDMCRGCSIDISSLSEESKSITIFNSTLDYLNITSEHVYNVIIKDSSRVFELCIDRYKLASKTNYYISDTEVNSLDISGLINKGDIIFNNVTPTNKIQLFVRNPNILSKPLIETNSFSFEERNEESKLWIYNSDLKDAQIVGCNFGTFDQFIFQNSKLLDVFVADTTLPHKNKIYTGGLDGDTLHLLEQKRLVLSQFKKIYEKTGDTVRATQYLAEEMEVYREQLKHQKITGSIEWWNNKGERFNLWLNRFSSYYGNNWLRAASLTLVINAALFWLYCWRLGFELAKPNDKNWALFKKLFSYSFEFLNPLRKADFLQTVAEPTNSARVIDYISRIIIAYFVYQTIAAFRKFGKKST